MLLNEPTINFRIDSDETPRLHEDEYGNLSLPDFDSTSNDSTQLEEVNLLPTKFQPTMTRHFVFTVKSNKQTEHGYYAGIDSFLIKSVKRTPWIAGWQKNELEIVVHSSIAPSAEQEIDELKEIEAGTAELRLLDPVGTVISHTTFTNVWLKEIHYPEHNYDKNGMLEYKVILGFGQSILHY